MDDINAATIIRMVAIAGMGLAELREQSRTRFGTPPKLRSPELLALMLAYRIQAAVEGGLDVELRRTRKLVRPAFLAPDLQRANLAGRQAPGLSLANLLQEPISTDWTDQPRAFG